MGESGTPVEANGTGGPPAFCSSCGAALRAGLRFCPTCGVPIDAPATGPTAADASPVSAEGPRHRPPAAVAAVVAVAVVTLAVVALVVVTRGREGGGDGAAAEVETTSSPASVAPATTSTTAGGAAAATDAPAGDDAPPAAPAPAAPPPDLRNVTLPSDACAWVGDYIALPNPLTLVDGAVPALDQYASIALDEDPLPSFADVDGDGSDEGLVPIICNAGGSGTTSEIHVYSSAGEHLDGIVVGEGVEGRPMLVSMTVGPGTLTVATTGTRPGEALCCGSLPVVDTYSFDGRQLTLTDRRTG